MAAKVGGHAVTGCGQRRDVAPPDALGLRVAVQQKQRVPADALVDVGQRQPVEVARAGRHLTAVDREGVGGRCRGLRGPQPQVVMHRLPVERMRVDQRQFGDPELIVIPPAPQAPEGPGHSARPGRRRRPGSHQMRGEGGDHRPVVCAQPGTRDSAMSIPLRHIAVRPAPAAWSWPPPRRRSVASTLPSRRPPAPPWRSARRRPTPGTRRRCRRVAVRMALDVACDRGLEAGETEGEPPSRGPVIPRGNRWPPGRRCGPGRRAPCRRGIPAPAAGPPCRRPPPPRRRRCCRARRWAAQRAHVQQMGVAAGHQQAPPTRAAARGRRRRRPGARRGG